MAPSGRRNDAFAALYRVHYPAVLAYARRRCEDTLARDVASETFLVAWRRHEEAQRYGLPWLYGTAALVLRNHERSSRRQQRVLSRLAAEPAPTSRDHADGQAEAEAVRRALLRLSDTDRELLLLVGWEQLEGRDLARALGCAPGTAAVRLHRARRRLRDALHDGQAQDVRDPEELAPAHQKDSP